MAETCSPARSLADKSNSYRLSLRANFSWTFVGNIIYSGCQWGIVVVLAKLGSPVLVGQYALGVAIAMPVIALSQLQLRPVIASDVREKYRFGEYLTFRLLATILAILIVLAIPLALHSSSTETPLIFMVGLALALESVSDLYYARLQLIDRMDRIAKSQIVRAPLSLTALGIVVHLTGSLVLGVGAMVIARLAVLIGYDMRPRTHLLLPFNGNSQESSKELDKMKQVLRPRWEPRMMGCIFWLASPLGIVALLVNLNSNIPRYFIQWSLGARELGIYSALGFMMSAGSLFAAAVSQAVFVRLARLHADGRNSEFVILLLKMAGIGTILGAGGILFAWIAGPELLRILYRPEYADQWHVLVWFMVVAWMSYISQFLGTAMTSARYFVHQIPLFATVVLAIIGASYLLVPRLGLTGAVLSNLIGATVQVLGSIFVLAFALRRKSSLVPAVQHSPTGI
jgi:O-antigen/teichoic acid export membrane protein